MAVSEQVNNAFKRITNNLVNIVGDARKDDLILLGITAGYTTPELQENFPELYSAQIEKGEDEIIEFEDDSVEDDDDDSIDDDNIYDSSNEEIEKEN